MDLTKVSEDIVNLVSVLNNRHTTFDERVESVEKLIKEKIINILEPESVYTKGEYYDGLGKYVGIVDTYPHGADYFVRNHHFAVMPGGDKITGGHVAKINKVKIREIKK